VNENRVYIYTKEINGVFIFVTLIIMKLGHFVQKIRNIWKVLKCGAGEGWRRPVGPIM
jgi:hypothetical protein